MSLTPKDIEAMLQAERESLARPPAQLIERVLGNVTASADAAPVSLVAKKTVQQSLAVPLKWLSVTVLGLGAAAVAYSFFTAPAPKPVSPLLPVERTVAPSPVTRQEPLEGPLPPPPAPAPMRARPPTRNPVVAKIEAQPSTHSVVEPDTAWELELLERARTSIQAGRGDEALPWLNEHQQRFPESVYIEERNSLAILGLLQAKRPDEARAHAEQFFHSFPRSIHRTAIEKALSAFPAPTRDVTESPGPRN
ncbi:MAG: hypothetical protein K1X64_21285 [Myxococcaceae bacterium]|nr:hypothetical protein [Myxococcaceae bacterium]